MPLISETTIDQVQARADIVELIGRYVPLKRSGRHFKANCPFHREKTPSFMVNTDKQIFHCFGCGVGGNIFSFLMQHDRLTFPEAVRQLADHVGIHVPEDESGQSRGAQEELAGLMEKICRYFERQLLESSKGKMARGYLERRGVSGRTRERFRIGLAPVGWNRLLNAANATGVSAAQLEAVGLVVQGKTHSYDRFRNRLIFPIFDIRGRVVGFGGRALDDQEPKYLNSPETALYTKGRHLFGLVQAKDAILKAKTAVVVEGYFDCAVLVDAGVLNVVAPLGTALTADQARLLKRYAEVVVLAFDADAAGEQATLRGIDLLIEHGLDVRIAQLPSGVDPDEYVRAEGREQFQQLLEQSSTLFDFLTQTAIQRFPIRTSEHKVRAAQFVLPTLAKMPNAMLRSEYVRLLAERLHLDEQAVVQEMTKSQPRSVADRPATERRASTVRSTAHGPERLLTALVLDDPLRWRVAQATIRLEDMHDPALRAILSVVGALESMEQPVTPARVISRLSEAEQGALVSELVTLAQSVTAKDEALDDCLRRVKADARKRQREVLREQIRAAEAAGREQDVQQLLAVYQQYLSAVPRTAHAGVATSGGG